ncbi:hypothetical protein [Clostridium saudiense]|jgi:hypothetical protein|uniref:hypothetical protein n=1 Tax=Clostridium saudiense TaxID=1414720 RepID=UPI0026710FA5|nr:hypothetical protein [Clostridium saudiense]
MVIHHRVWAGNNIKHKYKTVKEFIDNELMKIENKEKKYFRISTKVEFKGKRNLLLYFQDGKLKSHHSTTVAFDYNDVLEYDIFEYYSMNDISVENIISVDCDCEEEINAKFKESNRLNIDIDTIGMTREEKSSYRIKKMIENNNIKDTIKKEAKTTDDIIIKALNLLFEETEENVTLKNEVKELRRVLEEKEQQIKWLGMQAR